MNIDREIEQLIKLTPEEIDQLGSGVYGDFVMMQAVERLRNSSNPDPVKAYALEKYVMRSPDLDGYFDYSQVYFELLEMASVLNNGEDFLALVLTGIVYFAKTEWEGLFYQDYLDFARGLLYQEKYDLFLEILRRLVSKAPITYLLFTDLVEDFENLSQDEMASDLKRLGQRHYGNKWKPDDQDELLTKAHAANGGKRTSMPAETRAGILEIFTDENMIYEDDIDDFDRLFTYEEMKVFIDSSPKPESYVLLVPDLIVELFNRWSEEPVICKVIIGILKVLRESVLPELSVLGELLDANEKQVFISPYLGKTEGYSFESVAQMFQDSGIYASVRVDAGLMIMDIAEKDQDYRTLAVDLLAEMLKHPPEDGGDEIVSSLVASVLDTELYELKEAVAQAFAEDAVSPRVVTPESFNGKWALDLSYSSKTGDGRSILLECLNCGRVRRFPYDYILFSLNQDVPFSEWDSSCLFINRMVKCAKCGAVESYKVVLEALFGLFSPSFFMGESEDSKNEIHTKISEDIFFFSYDIMNDAGFTTRDLSDFRRQVISGQMRNMDLVLQGEYYLLVGRVSEALTALRQAYESHPDNRTGALALACAEHDFGDKQKARTLYQQVLETGAGDVFERLEEIETQQALAGLKSLKDGESSPFPYPLNIKGIKLLDRITGKKKVKKRRR